MTKIKAVSLVSGGLDSGLATRIVLGLGIELAVLNFTGPFCLCNKPGGCKFEAKNLAQSFGLEFKVVNVFDEFIEIVKNPKHGYGSNLNPCIDCRILMFKTAKKFMQEIGASFIVTGEVVGQRPMSQQRHTLRLIEKESGLGGLILRPLSAKLLPETIPEINGWVNREKLLSISGRSRKEQIALVKEFDMGNYPCPSGGCLLTDPGFSQRMSDLLKYSEVSIEEIKLLKVGRHFRLSPTDKLVVGRDETENEVLLKLAKETDFIFMPCEVKGPVALGRGKDFDNGLMDLSGSIVARYCDKAAEEKVIIKVRQGIQDATQELVCQSIKEESLNEFRI
ncbi:MAG: hypothetical protein Q8O13_05285 [Candidatus Omnitrophota bacterium]|nr:hypothetical protein [Candidatus Omnitrophota bacterium]